MTAFKNHLYLFLFVGLLPFLFFSCSMSPEPLPDDGASPIENVDGNENVPDGKIREAVVASALTLLGNKPNAVVMVRGREFILDCIGTVSAAWWGAGYDIQRDFSKYSGNGVTRLYLSLKAWEALKTMKIPQQGDIIIWANTYDRNEDGILYNDGITHAGLVVTIDEDGTVHYLHESYTRGVVIAFFNLLHPTEAKSPEGKIWNSPMYLGTNYGKTDNPPHWLSGDLWEVFGDADETATNFENP